MDKLWSLLNELGMIFYVEDIVEVCFFCFVLWFVIDVNIVCSFLVRFLFVI